MFYDFTATKMNGKEIPMSNYKGKVVIVVNTASKCGFTPQFEGLQALYEKYKDNLAILGFPCNQFASQEPAENNEIESFCKLNYGVSFNMFQKVDVNGENAHPLFKFLTSEKKGLIGKKIKWNFTKFLISKEGSVIKRLASTTKPEEMEDMIKELIEN